MGSITVNTPGGVYKITIEENILKKAGKIIKKTVKPDKLFIVTDKNVEQLYGESLNETLDAEGFLHSGIALNPGEKSKNMRSLEKILSCMTKNGVSRKSAVIAFGGGVIGDIAGFASAVYMRGIPYIGVPTTLLSQIDSSIGGKTAVNLKEGKNLAGSFHQPKAVITDPLLLKTLNDANFKEGMAEMIKYACIADKDMFDSLLKGVKDMPLLIENCCAIKKRVVEEDEKEAGIRMILNFGHTLGHAIENIARYRFSHGQAVAIGMAHITLKSEETGLTKKGTADSLKEMLAKYGLPHELPESIREKLYYVMLRDKKRAGGMINLVLLSEIGRCFIHPSDIKELKGFI